MSKQISMDEHRFNRMDIRLYNIHWYSIVDLERCSVS